MKTRTIFGFLTALMLAAVLISCGEKGVPSDDDVQPATSLQIVSGNDQQTGVGRLLPDSFTVRLKTSVGVPIAGDTINFYQITPRAGSRFFLRDVDNPSVGQSVTDENGVAWNNLMLDTIVGVDTIMVTSSRLGDTGAVYFVFSALPGAPRVVEKVSPVRANGSDTIVSDTAGQTLPMPFVVRVRDRYGNVVPDGKVVFKTSFRCLVTTDSSSQGPFELDTAFTFTDAQGEAQAQWILTVNPGAGIGYPNPFPELFAYAISGDTAKDTVRFQALATQPPVFAYYHDLRPILIENCHGSACHAGASGYRMDFYYELPENNNLVPGDTNSPFVQNLNPIGHKGGNINVVEEDKAARWAVIDGAAPGSSGLNSYIDHMKPIFDNNCVSCHGDPAPANSYDVSTHAGIRGSGSDAVPNAIAGDSSSVLVTRMIGRHNVSAQLADSIIRWVVIDSLRQY